ncbi:MULTISPECIES: asparagine synthase C-terminal domain-containing protein [unclassified Thioalkalivibrio]|uniref:asparagine synthase C-terminal domain-containing protein n=1 Tax=unclassified Thioalkalivibrio TaxID=2621013 RepID=UPI00039E984F|nr:MULTISPECIES: asparagine synthase C-terminal domain-containing protein [unclassified Thioalkalivibrio]
MKEYVGLRNVALRFDGGRWEALRLADDRVLYKPRYMTVDVDWANPDEIRRLRLPFLLVGYSGSGLRSIEASPGGVREMPLFYSCADGELIVSDRPGACVDRVGAVDQSSLSDFCFFGYVTGSRTLIRDVFSLEAGSLLCFSENAVKVYSGYAYNTRPVSEESKGHLVSCLDGVTEGAFDRVISGLHGRKVILPLSAGYDSRLLLCMLKKGGVESVKCYAWGAAGSRDVEISRRLAEKLGYEWELVPHSAERWATVVGHPWVKDMIREAASYVSISGLASLLFQERLRSIDERGSVVLVGHTGDFISGGHIPRSISRISSSRGVASLIGKRHGLYNFCPKDVMLRVEEQVETLAPGQAWYRKFEAWEQRERQAKFIVNTNRYYEGVGLAWGMPLWDAEYVDFWERIPLEHKRGSRLYREYARGVFRELGVEFGLEPRVRRAVPGVDLAKRGFRRVMRQLPLVKDWQKSLGDEFGLWSGLSVLEEEVRGQCEAQSDYVDGQLKKVGPGLARSPYEMHMRATLALLLRKMEFEGDIYV